MATLSEIGEFEAIRRLFGAPTQAARNEPDALAPPGGVVVGSGDDAAVLRPGPLRDVVVTTDAFVEGRHYAPAFFTPREIGARLALANLSDLAAMAAQPRWALVSIGARGDHDLEALVALQAGISETITNEGASIVGGNLVAVEGAEWLSLTLLGEVPHGRAWTRFGARPGDLLAVTGRPGRAGAGSRLAERLGDRVRDPEWRPLLEAWIWPPSRVGLALALASSGAVTAAIDVSDGFAGDAAHLCEASGVGAEVEDASWPPDPRLEHAASALALDIDALRFGPSDDYELLMAVDPSRRQACVEVARGAGVSLSFVGHLTDAPGVLTLRAADGTQRALLPRGFDHFGPPGTG